MKTMKNMICALGFVGILFGAACDSTTPMQQMPNLCVADTPATPMYKPFTGALSSCKCSNDEYAPRFNNKKMTPGRRAFLAQIRASMSSLDPLCRRPLRVPKRLWTWERCCGKGKYTDNNRLHGGARQVFGGRGPGFASRASSGHSLSGSSG